MRAAGDQSGGQAQGFDGAGLVGNGTPRAFGGIKRPCQGADAKHLRRLRQPFVAAVQRCSNTAVKLALQRIRQFVRQQPAHVIMLASVNQLVDLIRRNQAAGSIVNQHPVADFSPDMAQRVKPMAHTVGPAGTATGGHVKRFFGHQVKKPVTFCYHHQRPGQAFNAPKSRQRVQHHRLTGNAPVLLGEA